jgi:hypothetical protein
LHRDSVQLRANGEQDFFEDCSLMSVLKLPGMVACTGEVVVASENSNPEAVLTLTLRTEAGEECLMRISDQAAKPLHKIITEFNRTREFLFAEEQAGASATFQ